MAHDPPVSHGGWAGKAGALRADGQPRLRLVGGGIARPTRIAKPQQVETKEPVAITDGGDARWVLAVRVAEQLEGPILSPEKRERLIRLGRVLGLSPFDANLIIAIVQDQARRGQPTTSLAASAEPQLRMVGFGSPSRKRFLTGKHIAWVTAITIVFVAAEWWLLASMFRG